MADEVPAPARPRGGFRRDLVTAPECVASLETRVPQGCQEISLLCNYIPIEPMKERAVFQYRIDYEPEIESVRLRSRLFNTATREIFEGKVNYDKMSDAFSSIKVENTPKEIFVDHPTQPDTRIKITIKSTGILAWNSFELLRLYNMHMKSFLEDLGFFKISRTGAYVHPNSSQDVGSNTGIKMLRGFNTAVNMFENEKILMNLEPVHKLMQVKSVLDIMTSIKNREPAGFQEVINAELVNKLVIADYNRKHIYRIEAVEFNESPKTTFEVKGVQTSFIDYMEHTYGKTIRDKNQPLLRVVHNDIRASQRMVNQGIVLKLVPELCNIAGLTNSQRNDGQLRNDLIRSSQVSPQDRVTHIKDFLSRLHESQRVNKMLNNWGYSYSNGPVKIKAHVLPREGICFGQYRSEPSDKWPKVTAEANFENTMKRGAFQPVAKFPKMIMIIPKSQIQHENRITERLRSGFKKVGLEVESVPNPIRLANDSSTEYQRAINQLDNSGATIILVLVPKKDSKLYSVIKKLATVNLGMLTQVVTSDLMKNEKRAEGAAFKIALQIASKVGLEPWRLNINLTPTMICGYDTYHDTLSRGRSYGAFVASMNRYFTRWFSMADCHDRMQELSSQMGENVAAALAKFKQVNKIYPERIFIFRDGVGEGQLHQVFELEIKHVKKRMMEIDENIRLNFIVVTKRVGARFFEIQRGGQSHGNAPPGTVITDTVKRQGRCDFYLISQHTRNGTVTPTYYNIIHMDDNAVRVENIQQLSYKLCLMYYNWTGSVRVPAPCQYAHKLALLCGENLHQVPSTNLNDRLHFL